MQEMLKIPKIIGLTKVRNEEHIIKDTLNNWSQICLGGIYVYDDVSTDKTVQICKSHPAVKDVIIGKIWDPNREKAEWFNRQMVLLRAQENAAPGDWFVYFDADEQLDYFERFDLFYNQNIEAIACRVFDVYITPEDVNLHYKKRQMIGPEYRTIVFFFRNTPFVRYEYPDQRIVSLRPGITIPIHGDIKHYGKGFSIEEWEKTCDYYINYWPKYAEKWKKRKGKAVHSMGLSDFGNKLIKWEDRNAGFSLEDKPYGKN